MSIHASEQFRNIERTVMAGLVAKGLDPTRLVPAEDEKFETTKVPFFYRVTFQGMPEERAGKVGALHAIRARFICLVDCFARGSASQPPATIDTAVKMQEDVAHALRYLDLPLLDYVTDPTGATAVSGVAVRFHRPPEPRHVPPSDGFQRRQVSAVGELFMRHA